MRPHTTLSRAAVAPHRRQDGGALIAVLLLLVTMIMALGAMRTANLEERMAGNLRDRQVAFQLAEAALRDAELTIASDTDGPFAPLRPSQFNSACIAGLCRSAPDAPLWPTFSQSDWTGAKTWAYGAATGSVSPAGAASPPRFAIEYQGTLQPIEPGKPCVASFLLTARAGGANSATDVVLQSVYRHRVGECYEGI